jgi:hypothetical protein
MEEEREKERRASLDSTRSQEVTSPVTAVGGSSLERVDEEQKSADGKPGVSVETPSSATTARPSAPSKSSFTGIALPQLGGGADFGNEFWDSTPLGGTNGKEPAVISPVAPVSVEQDQSLRNQPSLGFRSMVHQAFDAPAISSKQGSLHSQAGTTDSAPSRSNTTGTSDISPIMSRVPSSAATGARNAEMRVATPAIAEETETSAHNSLQKPIKDAEIVAEKPLPTHSPNVSGGGIPTSFTPGYRRDLSTPSPHNSPARSPVLEENKQLPAAEAAQVATEDSHEAAAVHSVVHPQNTATQGTGVFPAANINLAGQSTAGTSAQNTSLESDAQAGEPEVMSKNIARSESPSKGRVADLAGRFNEIPAAPPVSAKENSSYITKESTSRPTSSSAVKPFAPTELASAARPVNERELSFRPKLPGQFDSYASSSSDVPGQPLDKTTAAIPVQGALNEVDLSPTTSKHQVEGKSIESSVGPMAALAAAGVAVGAAIRKSMGSEEAQPESPKSPSRAHGDILHRPPPPDRFESTASTIPPTPPAKDEELAPPVPLKVDAKKGAETSAIDTALSSVPTKASESSKDTTPTGFESDRLRREIVRSLSPEHEVGDEAPAVPEPQINRAPNRESTAILSDYENYWASGGSDEKQVAPVEHATHGLPEVAIAPSQPVNEPTLAAAPLASKNSSPSPVMLNKRFSWERSGANSVGPASVISPGSESTPKSLPGLQPQSDPLSLNPKLSGEPLHIVNAEPGELPTPVEPPARRLSSDFTAPVAPEPNQSQLQDFSPLNASTHPAGPRPQSGPQPQSGARPMTGDGTRPAPFREILAIKNTTARIAKYNETREQFAKQPTGLDNWLSKTVGANPDYKEISTTVRRPTLSSPTGASPRHKATASISRVFTKTDNQAGPSQNTGRPLTAEYQGKTGPAADQRISVGKGKDILKTAGVLGGKGMKEAKGLFAKGKSRFKSSGSEKVDD